MRIDLDSIIVSKLMYSITGIHSILLKILIGISYQYLPKNINVLYKSDKTYFLWLLFDDTTLMLPFDDWDTMERIKCELVTLSSIKVIIIIEKIIPTNEYFLTVEKNILS